MARRQAEDSEDKDLMLRDTYPRQLLSGTHMHTHTNADTGGDSLDADGGTQDPDAGAISTQVTLLPFHPPFVCVC